MIVRIGHIPVAGSVGGDTPGVGKAGGDSRTIGTALAGRTDTTTVRNQTATAKLPLKIFGAAGIIGGF